MRNIEEDIKFIEEMIKEYKTFGDLHNPDYEDTDRIYKALENMLKRIKELEQKNEHLKYLYDDCCKCLLDTIEKQKVKNKIKELENMLKKSMEGKLQEYTVEEIIIKINMLNELLEEGE